MFYIIARQAVRLYLKLFFKWQIRGKQNVPNNGPVLLVSNHISNFDPTVVACSISRQVHFMAKEELFKVPFVKTLVSALGAFPIKRGGNDRRAIKTGLELLGKNEILGIFPEGTRSKTGKIGKGLPGAALFALKTNAIVIPIGIVSEYKLFKPLTIKFGQPISLDRWKQDKLKSEVLEEAINYIMGEIKKQVDEIKGHESIL